MGYVGSAKNEAETREALTDVYVVDKLVPKGSDAETIKASVSTEKVPNRLVQPGAVDNLKDVSADTVAASDLQPGDQLVAARVVPKNQVDPSVQGKVQVSAQLTSERAVGGTIAKGDTVGVYLSFDPVDTTPTTPELAKSPRPRTWSSRRCWSPTCRRPTSRCNRTKAPTTARRRSVDQVTASEYIVTLALTPAQSERFVFATEFGHVWLADEPATVSDDGTQIITLGNVFTVVK